VYVIGDSAASRRANGTYQPALSQTAIAMGAQVGKELDAIAHHRTAPEFSFHDAGYIISLGKHSSVVDLFGVPLSGKLAWLLWAGAYLVKMVGFRKQIEVAIDHVTHFFFTHDTSQILNRRAILSDEELNLSLGGNHDGTARPDPARSGQTVDQR
jgi:NADH dehydrogenase